MQVNILVTVNVEMVALEEDKLVELVEQIHMFLAVEEHKQKVETTQLQEFKAHLDKAVMDH